MFFASLTGDGKLPRHNFRCAGVVPAIDKSYFNYAKNLILNTKRTAWVVMYNCRYYGDSNSSPANDLLYALCRQAKNGADVRVILDASDFNEEVNRSK